jgi:hypothetical protein
MHTHTDTDTLRAALALLAAWPTLHEEVLQWEADTRAALPRGSIWPKPPANLARRLAAWRKSAKAVCGWEQRTRPTDGLLVYALERKAALK